MDRFLTDCNGCCSYEREGYGGGGYGREPAGYGRCVYIMLMAHAGATATPSTQLQARASAKSSALRYVIIPPQHVVVAQCAPCSKIAFR